MVQTYNKFERTDEKNMIQSIVNGIQQLTFFAWEGFVPDGEIGTGGQPAVNQAGDAAATAGNYVTQAAEGATGGGLMGGLPLILVYVALFGGIWFFLLRPHKRREKKLKELQSTIKTGDNVVTNGGMFGKVTDVGTDCFVVEMGISGRTVKVPILKTDVLGVREPVLTPPPKDTV